MVIRSVITIATTMLAFTIFHCGILQADKYSPSKDSYVSSSGNPERQYTGQFCKMNDPHLEKLQWIIWMGPKGSCKYPPTREGVDQIKSNIKTDALVRLPKTGFRSPADHQDLEEGRHGFSFRGSQKSSYPSGTWKSCYSKLGNNAFIFPQGILHFTYHEDLNSRILSS